MSAESPFSRFVFGQPAVQERAVTTRHAVALIGRVVLGAIFLVSGWAKLTDPAGAVGFMTAKGIPAAGTLVYVAGVAEILGALSIMLGLVTRVGAIGLAAFLVITSVLMHDFWSVTGDEQRTQMVQFMKNLSILGGLLMLIVAGAGRFSLDRLLAGGGPIVHANRLVEAPASRNY